MPVVNPEILKPSPTARTLSPKAAAGYPGDKPSGTLWQSMCRDVTILSQGTGFLAALSDCASGGCDNIIKHTCLSSDGQSGSGMWDPNNLQHAILTGKVGSAWRAGVSEHSNIGRNKRSSKTTLCSLGCACPVCIFGGATACGTLPPPACQHYPQILLKFWQM